MNEFESNLATLARTRASAELDERMHRLFAASAAVPARRRTTWWWGFAAGFGLAVAAAVLVVTANRTTKPAPHVVIRRIAPNDPISRLLDQPRHRSANPPRIIVQIQPSDASKLP